MTTAMLLFFLSVSATLLYFLLSKKKAEQPPAIDEKTIVRHCPLCGQGLQRKELVKTVVYPGKDDKIMEMFGCPYCRFPDSPNTRSCPVCHKTLDPDSFVIARLFERPGQKKHVHILGCSLCYRRLRS